MPVSKLPDARTWLIIGVTGALAWASATDAWVNVTHSKLPESALAADSDDPVALIRAAQIRLASGRGFEGGAAQVSDIVRRSVTESPINAPALRLLGSMSSAEADIEGVRRQMALSDRIARRDAATQLWLIEDAVIRNDVDAALRHYDTALRISESTRALLYPVLTDAIQEPVIRERFVPYVRQRPPWLHSFFRHALAQSTDHRAMADLLRMAGGMPEGTAFSAFSTQVMRGLVTQGHFDDAIAYYRRMDGADPALLTSLELTSQSTSESLAPVSWQPYSVPGIEPFVVASAGGGVEIESEIEPGFNGPYARKLLALEPGRYSIRIGIRADGAMPRDSMSLNLECAGATERTALVRTEQPMSEEFSLGGTFTVPGQCPVQALGLSARVNPSTDDVEVTLVDAKIRRVASRAPSDD